MHRLALILCGLSLSLSANATLTFNGSGGSSGADIIGTTTTIYGGLAGPVCSIKEPNQVCNNCADAQGAGNTANCTNANGEAKSPLCGCNERRIYDGLQVSIAVKKSASNANKIYAVVSNGGTGTTTVPTVGTPNPDSITFSWTTICGYMNSGGGGNCESQSDGAYVTLTIFADAGTAGYDSADESFQVTFKILKPGVEDYVYGASTTAGIGGFIPFPGDGRAYLKDINTPATFPTLNSGPLKYARVFVSKVSMNEATVLKYTKRTELEVQDAGSTLSSRVVDDLDNGELYFVRIGMLDQANNVVQFYPDQLNLPASCTTAPSDACPFAVRPDQVLGMLTKDLNCFIATAAFGSSLEPKLDTFREFRQRILLPHKWGKDLVLNYYKYGPYAARAITDSPVLRMMARGLLWPVYLWISLALKIGLTYTLIVTAMGIAALTWFGFRRWPLRA